MIQGGLHEGAADQVDQALEPILQGLMQQRGANMILDKNAVVFANSRRLRHHPAGDRPAEPENAHR